MDKVLISVLLVALMLAGIAGYQRIYYENANNTVELVFDLNALKNLASDDLTLITMLNQLKQLGVKSIALTEMTLAQKIIANQVGDFDLASRSLDSRVLLNEPVGFDPEEVALLRLVGMEPVPRLEPNQIFELSAADKLGELEPNLIIFNGDVVGYPDQIYETKMQLESVPRVGLVEFANQRGIGQIATSENSVRVHGINAREMEVLSAERVLTRYLRSVRERNIRVLYMRPFGNDDGWDRTLTLATDLIANLETSGYKIGSAQPYQFWQPSLVSQWLISLGVVAGTLLLLQKWVLIPIRWLCTLAILLSGLSAALLFYNLLLGQQTFALLAAIVFPTYAMTEIKFIKQRVLAFLRVVCWSLAGALLIVGLLYGSAYLVKLAEFRGVKLMHVAPIILTFATSVLSSHLPLTSWRQLKAIIKGYYEAAIPVKHLIYLGLIGLVGGIYLLRTGNFTLPVSQFELFIREGLEQFLLVRPRFKEMFLGHPALLLVLASKRAHPILLSIAVIGQLSLVNTFTHIHTALPISIIRTVYGLIIGYCFGLLIWMLYQKLKRRVANDPRFRILRLP